MRASRLLSILILLQLRGRMTAAELAETFEVTERTVYRDIDALSMAGVPVYGDRGPGGGFALLDGYRTRLTGLAADEAEAMPMIGMMGLATDLGLGSAARSARNKLMAALPDQRQGNADRVSERVHFDPVDWYQRAEPLADLPAIARAVFDQHEIAMHYASWSGERDWQVHPLGLILKAGQWYLSALGHGSIRTFRLGAMSSVVILEQRFERPAGFDLAEWWVAQQARMETDLFSTTAVLRVTPEASRRLAAVSPRGAAAVRGARQAQDGLVMMDLAFEDSDHGVRELVGLGPGIEVMAPANLRRRVHAMASSIAALNSGEGE